jgi:hypothetical protein
MIRPAAPEDYDVLARAWYEREGFRCEGEETVPPSGLRMKVYRWKRP